MQISSLHHSHRPPLAGDAAALRPQRSQEILPGGRSAQTITPQRNPLPLVQAHSLPVSASPQQGFSTCISSKPVQYRLPNLKLSSESSQDAIATNMSEDIPRPRCTFHLPGLSPPCTTELHTSPRLPIISPTPPPSAQTHTSGCFLPSRGSCGHSVSTAVKHYTAQPAQRLDGLHPGILDVLGTSPSCLSLSPPVHMGDREQSKSGAHKGEEAHDHGGQQLAGTTWKQANDCHFVNNRMNVHPCEVYPKRGQACKPPGQQPSRPHHAHDNGGPATIPCDLEAWGKREGCILTADSAHVRGVELSRAFAVRGRQGGTHCEARSLSPRKAAGQHSSTAYAPSTCKPSKPW